jgi:hypothetical protein
MAAALPDNRRRPAAGTRRAGQQLAGAPVMTAHTARPCAAPARRAADGRVHPVAWSPAPRRPSPNPGTGLAHDSDRFQAGVGGIRQAHARLQAGEEVVDDLLVDSFAGHDDWDPRWVGCDLFRGDPSDQRLWP